MDTLTMLEEMQQRARRDADVKSALLATRTEADPLSAFCKCARSLGYELYPMEVVQAGEDFYASVRRSTNGGGENSPLLEGQDDFYEMFFERFKAGQARLRLVLNRYKLLMKFYSYL